MAAALKAFTLPPNTGEVSPDSTATAQLLDLGWHQLLLYPKGSKAGEVFFVASLHLPAGWKSGTALPLAGAADGELKFAPVSLETLVDSPLIAGHYFRTVDLTPGARPAHLLHMVADSEAALEIEPEDAAHFSHLVAETGALFGARHYHSYHFLLTLSDQAGFRGLEHHESSDVRMDENYLTEEAARKLDADLLPHEMVHSWNGKYRRPAGLATADFQQPMNGDLLWVYEGLTEYLGIVLTARSGLWADATFREDLAYSAALLEHQAGRQWRPLADTTVAAQLLYPARTEGSARRRGADFYREGALIWLEADVSIRQQTQGRRSLDDFCKKFLGGESGPPKVVTYTFDDLLAALNDIAPHDWRQFFQQRVYAINPHAPLAGIEAAGWHLAYTNEVPSLLKIKEDALKFTDLSFSLGLRIKADGAIEDVIPGSPADKAQIGPGLKLVAVNGRRWTPEILRAAVTAAEKKTTPIELLVENNDYLKTCAVDYHAGEQYPCLERDPTKPDLLGKILKPLTPAPAVSMDK